MSIRVKICGLTNLEDARRAAHAGADYLGFILFEGSPRYVTPDAVRAIIEGLRTAGLTTPAVGVFVNVDHQYIQNTLAATGFDYAQLHGDEGPELLAALAPLAYKAVRPMQAEHALQLAAQFHTSTVNQGPSLLVDAYDPAAYGGTGKLADQQIATRLAQRYDRVLLAGGLTPDNVAQAIAQVQPWGVDVSSGVEASPGRKDHAAIDRFIAAVRAVSAPD
jgi:phosphoribosylanthranilate isomerase